MDPLLSLDAVRSLTLNLSDEERSIPALDGLSLARLDSLSTLLKLDTLRISVSYDQQGLFKVNDSLYYSFYPLVDPARAVYEVRDRPNAVWMWTSVRPEDCPLLPWHSLECIELRGMIPYRWMRDLKACSLFGISGPRPNGRGRRFRFHLPSMTTDQDPQPLSLMITQDSCEVNFSLGHPGSVVFVVGSAEERTRTEAVIQARGAAKWRSVFAVEVET